VAEPDDGTRSIYGSTLAEKTELAGSKMVLGVY